MIKNDKLIKVFAIQLEEFIQKFEETINEIKKNPYNNNNEIQTLIRIHHTLKGDAGLFEMENLMQFCRHIESLLKSNKETKNFQTIVKSILPILSKSLEVLGNILVKLKKKDIADLDPSILNSLEKSIESIG